MVFAVGGSTSLAVTLDPPLPVRLRDGASLAARRVHFAVDKPAEAIALIREARDSALSG